jgi:hypothetical protein
MTYFLPEGKRKELIDALVKCGMHQDSATNFAEVEDDMLQVDINLKTHAECITHFREQVAKGKAHHEKHVNQGLLILTALMDEAINRGLGETDFPMSLEYIKNEVMQEERKNIVKH